MRKEDEEEDYLDDSKSGDCLVSIFGDGFSFVVTKRKESEQRFNHPALFLPTPTSKDTVNPTKCGCPFALKMAACQLLLEITTFLRETFPCLPRPRTEPLVVSSQRMHSSGS